MWVNYDGVFCDTLGGACDQGSDEFRQLGPVVRGLDTVGVSVEYREQGASCLVHSPLVPCTLPALTRAPRCKISSNNSSSRYAYTQQQLKIKSNQNKINNKPWDRHQCTRVPAIEPLLCQFHTRPLLYTRTYMSHHTSPYVARNSPFMGQVRVCVHSISEITAAFTTYVYPEITNIFSLCFRIWIIE